MKTSTNTAAAAQIGAVKRRITTTDDSVAARKQKVARKLREAIRGVSLYSPTSGQLHSLRSTWTRLRGSLVSVAAPQRWRPMPVVNYV